MLNILCVYYKYKKKKTISAAADHTIAVVNVQFPDRTEDIL